MRSLLTAAVVLCTMPAMAATWYVNADNAGGTQDGTAWATAFVSIQEAVDAANADGGGDVFMATGTYTATSESVVQMRSGVNLYGGFAGGETAQEQADPAANVTIIDGETDRRGVVGDSGALIRGFTITRGYADVGGGMRNFRESPTIEQCIFLNNEASQDGGGMFNTEASPVIQGCSFIGNAAAGDGGGLYSWQGSSPNIQHCRFENNWAADDGGAIFIDGYFPMGTPRIEGCAFVDNSADDSGGAIHTSEYDNAITRCLFRGNTAGNGGAIANWDGTAKIRSSLFIYNDATDSVGGAIANWTAAVQVTNVGFVGNGAAFSGGAMHTEGVDPVVVNCTFSDNTALDQNGGAISNDGASPTITNCILWDNLPDAIRNVNSSRPTVTYSDVQGGYVGMGNIDADPFLQNPPRGFLRVLSTSPTIDAGIATDQVLTDRDGVARPQGGAYDMGMFEFLDRDGDGLDDTWEGQNGLNPDDGTDGASDLDGDGLSARQEYETGSSPQDGEDPVSRFFVDPAGDDELGDGSAGNPWRTIAFAMEQASAQASTENPVAVQLAAGLYEEKVQFADDVILRGVSGTDPSLSVVEPRTNQLSTDDVVVEGANNTALEDLTVRLPLDAPSNVKLVKIADVAMLVDSVVLNGQNNSDAIAVDILGLGSSDSVVKASRIENVTNGVRSRESRANIAGNTFSDIRFDAIFVREPSDKQAETEPTPLLGDINVEGSGGNSFENVAGLFINNNNPNVVKAEANDWGTPLYEEIKSNMNGNVDFTPFRTSSAGLLSATLVVTLEEQGTANRITSGVVSLDLTGLSPVSENDNGVYVFPGVAPRAYTLTARATGFEDATAAVSPASGQILQLTQPMTPLAAEGEGEGEGEGEPGVGCAPGKAAQGPGADAALLVLVVAVLLTWSKPKRTFCGAKRRLDL